MKISRDEARWRILTFLNTVPGDAPVTLAQLGEAAFQDALENRSPQGAAFSAAKLVKDLIEDQLVDKDESGYYLAPLGLKQVAAGRPAIPTPPASLPRRRGRQP